MKTTFTVSSLETRSENPGLVFIEMKRIIPHGQIGGPSILSLVVGEDDARALDIQWNDRTEFTVTFEKSVA